MAKALTKRDIEKIIKELQNKDLSYAKSISNRIEKFFRSHSKSTITNWYELKVANEQRRLMLGMHTEKTEISGNIRVVVMKNGAKLD